MFFARLDCLCFFKETCSFFLWQLCWPFVGQIMLQLLFCLIVWLFKVLLFILSTLIFIALYCAIVESKKETAASLASFHQHNPNKLCSKAGNKKLIIHYLYKPKGSPGTALRGTRQQSFRFGGTQMHNTATTTTGSNFLTHIRAIELALCRIAATCLVYAIPGICHADTTFRRLH